MKFTQKTVEDLLTGWQNSSNLTRDLVVVKAFYSEEYSKDNPPRFSQNVSDKAETDKLISKINELGYCKIVEHPLPRSTLCIVKCGDVAIPPMPYHKAIAFIVYCAAILSDEE